MRVTVRASLCQCAVRSDSGHSVLGRLALAHKFVCSPCPRARLALAMHSFAVFSFRDMFWCCLCTDTPADTLLSVLADLLEGVTPDLRDVVLVRTALQRDWDVYAPFNLRSHIKGANLDVSGSGGGHAVGRRVSAWRCCCYS